MVPDLHCRPASPAGFRTPFHTPGCLSGVFRYCPSNTVHTPKPHPTCPRFISQATFPTALRQPNWSFPRLTGCFYIYGTSSVYRALSHLKCHLLQHSLSQRLQSSGGLTRLNVQNASLICLGCRQWPLASLSGFGISQHGSWFPRGHLPKAGVLRSQGRSRKASSDVALVYQVRSSPEPRGGDVDSTSQWEE